MKERQKEHMRSVSTNKKYSDIFNVYYMTKANKHYYFGSPSSLLKMFELALGSSLGMCNDLNLLHELKWWCRRSSWIKIECVFVNKSYSKDVDETVCIHKYKLYDYQKSSLKNIFDKRLRQQTIGGKYNGK